MFFGQPCAGATVAGPKSASAPREETMGSQCWYLRGRIKSIRGVSERCNFRISQASAVLWRVPEIAPPKKPCKNDSIPREQYQQTMVPAIVSWVVRNGFRNHPQYVSCGVYGLWGGSGRSRLEGFKGVSNAHIRTYVRTCVRT